MVFVTDMIPAKNGIVCKIVKNSFFLFFRNLGNYDRTIPDKNESNTLEPKRSKKVWLLTNTFPAKTGAFYKMANVLLS